VPLSGHSSAVNRLILFFASAATRQALLARRALGRPAPDDAALAQRLVREIAANSGRNGTAMAGVATICRAHELLDLGGCDERAWRKLMESVTARQGQPGAFGQGCSRTRHAHRVCEHFVSGFFSPAPPEQRVAPVMLPNGKMFRAEPAARFALSCLALRVALRGGQQSSPAVERHLISLRQLQEQWSDWNGYFAGDMIVAGIHALAWGPQSRRDLRPRLTSLITARQERDGTWDKADLFHTLEALLALGTPEAREAVRRAVPALLQRQRQDGSFGATAQQERALIALRALLWAEPEG
jgi:hypothetical protein